MNEMTYASSSLLLMVSWPSGNQLLFSLIFSPFSFEAFSFFFRQFCVSLHNFSPAYMTSSSLSHLSILITYFFSSLLCCLIFLMATHGMHACNNNNIIIIIIIMIRTTYHHHAGSVNRVVMKRWRISWKDTRYWSAAWESGSPASSSWAWSSPVLSSSWLNEASRRSHPSSLTHYYSVIRMDSSSSSTAKTNVETASMAAQCTVIYVTSFFLPGRERLFSFGPHLIFFLLPSWRWFHASHAFDISSCIH